MTQGAPRPLTGLPPGLGTAHVESPAPRPDPGIYLGEGVGRGALHGSSSHRGCEAEKQAESSSMKTHSGRAAAGNADSHITRGAREAHYACALPCPRPLGRREKEAGVVNAQARAPSLARLGPGSRELHRAGLRAQPLTARFARSRLGKCARAGVSGRRQTSPGRRGALWEGLRK